MSRIVFLVLCIALLVLSPLGVAAQEPGGGPNTPLATSAGGGATAFLFGAFCALWAQNTGRNPWLWFFLGLFFSVITAIVLLAKNARDRKRTMALGDST